MDGRINVAEAPEIMVSRRPPNPIEKATPAWIPRPNSPLENTPHNARIVYGDAMPAVVLLDMAAQGRCSAVANILEGFSLLTGESMPPPRQKIVFVDAEHIGHFWPMLTHHSGRKVVAA